MKYRIATDLTADMPESYYKENEIKTLGLMYYLDGNESVEGGVGTLSQKEFFAELRAGKSSATAQINSEQFIEFVEPLLEAGEDVLYLSLSSKISGSYNSCKRGAEELSEKYPDRKIFVVDTLSASLGQGLLLKHVVENRSSGMSIEDNVKWLEENKLHVIHIVTVNDLMHLHRGGRVSKASAVMGSLLGIKPIIEVSEFGGLEVTGKARGREKSFTYIAKLLKEKAYDNIKEQTVLIVHGDCLDDAHKLAKEIEKVAGVTKFEYNYVGKVIGSHTGPGALAAFCMGKKR